MGDGNFHLQLRKLSASLKEDPSLYNDSGFWSKVDVHSNYLLNAKHHVSSNVCIFKFDNTALCLSALLSPVEHEQVIQAEIGHLKDFK